MRAFLSVALLSLLFVAPADASLLTIQASSYAMNLDRQAYTYDQVIVNSAAGTLVAGQVYESLVSLSSTTVPYDVKAQARADYGLLGVSAEVSMDGSRPQVVADARSTWTDTFTIASGGAPDGTPVTILTTMVVDIGQLTSSGVAGSALYYGSLLFNTNLDGNWWCLMGVGGVGASNINCQNTYGTDKLLHVGSNLISFETQTTVGTHTWESTLWADASVNLMGSAPPGPAHVFVDALHTAHSYFTILTPGATMQSASGHDYSLPSVETVPEPSTYALMFAGLGALGFVTRGRRHH